MTAPDDHRAARLDLGAHVLGALEPEDRSRVDQHLQTCSTCRREMADLAALPGLLGLLGNHGPVDPTGPTGAADPTDPTGPTGAADPTDPAGAAGPPDAARSPAVVATLAIGRRRRARRRRVWAAVAVVLVLGLAGAGLALRAGSPPVPDLELAVVQPGPAAGPGVTGVARVDGHQWGMTVAVELSGLPAEERFVLWAVTEDGYRTQAASWQASPDGRARIEGSCYLPLERLHLLEVTVADVEVVATLAA